MSDNNDDTLLEGDLEDDVEYDLGNEDEDALLADDYDVQGSSHRTVYLEEQEVLESQDGYHREPEEPFDDVLDLGVTEGDDLDSELQESQEPFGGEKNRHTQDPNLLRHDAGHMDGNLRVEHQQQADLTDASHVSQETSYVEGEDLAANQGVARVESEEDEEDAEESRGDRFKTERTTIVSLKTSNKSYGNIPDSLDNVCVEDGKQLTRREAAWRGGRRGRGGFIGRGVGGGPRPQFAPGNATGSGNFNIHPLQQQGFVGPRFGPGGFVRPPGRPGTRGGGGMYNRPQMNQQQQSPHKILINPHFRGAVQPHPEARLIWDTEMPANQTPLPPQQQTSQGDSMTFSSGIQTHEPPYQTTPPGGGYAAQQFQPPPQHDPHPIAPSPRYDSPSQQGGYYPAEQSYTEQHNIPHWQDSIDPPQQVGGDMYTHPNPVPMSMESNMHHEPTFHHLNHGMGELNMNPGQPMGGAYGGGMVQYDTVSQQQGMFHDDNNYPPPVLPTQQHYHSQPPPMSPSGHRLPPPVMGIYRLPAPAGVPGPMKFRQPSPGPYHHPPAYMNPGSRPPRGAPRFPPGMQVNVPHHQQMIRMRQPLGGPVHQQQSPQQLQQMNRSPKKRPLFETNSGGNVQFKQVRFDAAVKRKKRMPDMSNLHEVQTVDMLPPDMNSRLKQKKKKRKNGRHMELGSTMSFAPCFSRQSEEDEDEETREYRKKIEQQKREREKFLQRKEERRKLAALEKQRELQKKDMDIQAGGDAPQFQLDPPQGNAIATIVNRNTVEPQPVIHYPVVRHIVPQQPQQKLQHHIQAQKVKNRINVQQQFHQDVELPQAPAVLTSTGVVRQVRGGRGRGRGVGRGQPGVMNRQQQVPVPPPQQDVKLVPKMKVPDSGQRIIRAPQPGNLVNQSPAAPRRLVLTQGAGHQVAPVPPRQVIQQIPKGRTVVLRGANSGSKPIQQQQQQQQQANQQQRIVVASKAVQQQGVPNRQAGGGRSVVATKVMPPPQQDVGAQQPALPRTKMVSIENLAASTTDHQLKSLCQGIGVVENIQMLPKQRRAILRFANPTSAATFYKRYQRKIIDLSLITVSLIPQ